MAGIDLVWWRGVVADCELRPLTAPERETLNALAVGQEWETDADGDLDASPWTAAALMRLQELDLVTDPQLSDGVVQLTWFAKEARDRGWLNHLRSL